MEGLRRKYSTLAKRGQIHRILELVRQTGIEPRFASSSLKTLYLASARGYVSSYDLDQITEWDKVEHGGTPRVFNSLGSEFANTLQEGYFTLVLNERITKEEHQKIVQLTGVPITEETVQRAINQRIKDENVLGDYYFKKVESATGITPKPDMKVVQNLYKSCLRREKFEGQRLYFWEYLAESTKIMPEEKTAQSAFRYFMRKKRIGDLIRFSEFTGITPEERTVRWSVA